MKKLNVISESMLREELDVWYEMEADTVKHFFGDAVKKVYVGCTDSSKPNKQNWNEFDGHSYGGFILEFNNGCIVKFDDSTMGGEPYIWLTALHHD